MSGTDWQPLAPADPVPGDPAELRRLAACYQRAAQEVGTEGPAVRRTGTSAQWSGSAAQAFQARVGDLPADLDLVSSRFQRVAGALLTFAAELEAAQGRAWSARLRAQAGEAAAAVRAAAVERAIAAGTSRAASRPVVGPPGPAAPWDRPGTGPLSFGADDPEVAHARRLLAVACEERDRAARRCSRAIRAAAHDRLRNPGAWQRLLGAVSTWAGLASAWLGVAALALCVVPGLGPLLGGASLVLALVQLGADAALASSGDAGWAGVGVDLLGVLPLGRAARLGAAMSRGRAVERAAAHAAVPRLGAVAAGRALQRLAASPLRFEGSRGLHGLAQVVSTRPGREVAASAAHLAEAVRVARPTRSLAALLRSPGGVLDEIALARCEGPTALVWLSGGHAVEVAQATVGVPFTPAAGAR